jgi:hypothetical protein
MSDKFILISTDGHAGLPPERYRDYIPEKYHAQFDKELEESIEARQLAEKHFLLDEFNKKWREGIEEDLKGAWHSEIRNDVLDGDGVVAEVLFPDGITEHNSPPFGADLGLKTWGVDPELQWVGAQAHNKWMAEFVAESPERRMKMALKAF